MKDEALKLALDALDIAQGLLADARSYHQPKMLAAYTAVKQALAPAQPVTGEKIYLDDGPEWNGRFEAWWEDQGQFCRAGGGEYEKTFAFRAWEAALATPPAAAQRQWVGLTDAELNDMHATLMVKLRGCYETKDLYKAIEQRLKEKNT